MSGRRFALLLVFLMFQGLLLLAGYAGTPVRASLQGDAPPASGDWFITHNTTVDQETLVWTGDITVSNGSVLRLQHSTLQFNASSPGRYDLVVEAGSTLILNDTRLEARGSGLIFMPGSRGSITDSTLLDIQGEAGGLVFRGSQLELLASNLTNSSTALTLYRPATVLDNNFSSHEVAIALYDVQGGQTYLDRNTYLNNSQARLRYHVASPVLVVDDEGVGVRGAQVYLNDSSGRPWYEGTTRSNGTLGPLWLPVWEVLSNATNTSLEPYSLTALKRGVTNQTAITPSAGGPLKVELPVEPDLTIEAADISWSDVTSSLTPVPAGRDNATRWAWKVLDPAAELPDSWYEPALDDRSWTVAAAPFGDYNMNTVDNNTVWQGNSIALFRHTFRLPDGILPLEGTLFLAANNYGSYYLEGQLLFSDWRQGGGHGASYWRDRVEVTPALLQPGRTLVLAALVEETGMTQWFDAQLELTYIAPGQPKLAVNNTAAIAVQVENQGTNDASNVEVKLYNGSEALATRQVEVEAGGSTLVVFQWTPDRTGPMELRVELDEADNLTESNESNNNVTVTVPVEEYGVELSATGDNASLPFTDTAMFQLRVHNSGNLSDNLSLEVPSWPSGWQVDLDRSNIELQPGNTGLFNLTVRPRVGAPVGNYTLAVRATSRFYQGQGQDPRARDELPLKVELLPTHHLELSSGSAGGTQLLDTTVNYTLTVEDPGHFNETLDISIDTLQTGSGWSLGEVPQRLKVVKGASADLVIQVASGVGLAENDTLNLTVNLTQDRYPYLNLTYYLFLTAQEPVRSFRLASYGQDLDQLNETLSQYNVTLMNTGNVDLTLEIQLAELDREGPWVNTYAEGPLLLAAGQQADYTFQVEALPALRAGSYLNLSLTFTARETPGPNHTYLLNLTGQNPPDIWAPVTVLKDLPNWIDNDSVELAWSILADDYADTRWVHLFYKTVDVNNTHSAWVPLGRFEAANGSTNLSVRDGLTYLVYTLGEDATGNLEADKRPRYDRWFTVDMTPPTTHLQVGQFQVDQDRGTLTETAIPLAWQVTGATREVEIRFYVVEYRQQKADGSWGDWQDSPGMSGTLATTGVFQGQYDHLYRFRVIALDKAGNLEQQSGWEAQVRLDHAPLMVSLEPLPPRLDGEQVTLQLDHEDFDDIATVVIEYTNYKQGRPPLEYDWRELASFSGGALPREFNHSSVADGYLYFYRVSALAGHGTRDLRSDRVDRFSGTGQANRSYWLTRPLLPPLRADQPTLRVEVDEDQDGVMDVELTPLTFWPLVGSNLVYVDLTTGELRFGDGAAGYRPGNASSIQVTYQAYDAFTLIDRTAPQPAGNFQAPLLDRDHQTATLIWGQSPSEDVMAYRLEVAATDQGPWTMVAVIPRPTDARSPSTVFDQLQEDHTYYFRVIALDQLGHEAASNAHPLLIDLSEPLVPVVGPEDPGSDEGLPPAVLFLVFLVVLGSLVGLYFLVDRQRSSTVARPWGKPRPPGRSGTRGEAGTPRRPANAGGEGSPGTSRRAGLVPLAGTDTGQPFQKVEGEGGKLVCTLCGRVFLPEAEAEPLACPDCGTTAEAPGSKEPSCNPSDTDGSRVDEPSGSEEEPPDTVEPSVQDSEVEPPDTVEPSVQDSEEESTDSETEPPELEAESPDTVEPSVQDSEVKSTDSEAQPPGSEVLSAPDSEAQPPELEAESPDSEAQPSVNQEPMVEEPPGLSGTEEPPEPSDTAEPSLPDSETESLDSEMLTEHFDADEPTGPSVIGGLSGPLEDTSEDPLEPPTEGA